MSELITYDQVLTAANDVVAEQGPDFKYCLKPGTQCYYVPLADYVNNLTAPDLDGGVVILEEAYAANDPRLTTGCLAGRIMDHLGIIYDPFSMSTVWALVEDKGIMTRKALDFLGGVQKYQDEATPWGLAVVKAAGFTTENFKNRSEDGLWSGSTSSGS